METKKQKISELSFNFAVEIISYCETLEKENKQIIAQQLLVSGTLIGANVSKSKKAKNRQDLIDTLKMAEKKAEETKYWLKLCEQSNYPSTESLQANLLKIKKILSKSIDELIRTTHKPVKITANHSIKQSKQQLIITLPNHTLNTKSL